MPTQRILAIIGLILVLIAFAVPWDVAKVVFCFLAFGVLMSILFAFGGKAANEEQKSD